ncbi:hypothetical protein ABH925_001038 [Streptacidiphilus sp. EB129]
MLPRPSGRLISGHHHGGYMSIKQRLAGIAGTLALTAATLG